MLTAAATTKAGVRMTTEPEPLKATLPDVGDRVLFVGIRLETTVVAPSRGIRRAVRTPNSQSRRQTGAGVSSLWLSQMKQDVPQL